MQDSGSARLGRDIKKENCMTEKALYFCCYQTEHFISGFILLPIGQLKSLAKYSLLLAGPIILNSPGA